jgi:hypothetical protein
MLYDVRPINRHPRSEPADAKHRLYGGLQGGNRGGAVFVVEQARRKYCTIRSIDLFDLLLYNQYISYFLFVWRLMQVDY